MSTSRPEPSAPSPDAAQQPAPTPAEVAEQATGDATGPAPAPAADDAATPRAQDTATAEPEAPTYRAVDVADPSRVRRAPRYGRFALLGFAVAVVLSLVLALVGVSDYETRDVFLIVLLALGTVGVFAGLAVALVSDRRSLRRRD